MKANIECSINVCGVTMNGTIVEIINNTENHAGDAIVSVQQTFPPRHAKDDPRHREFLFRIPLNELGGAN